MKFDAEQSRLCAVSFAEADDLGAGFQCMTFQSFIIRTVAIDDRRATQLEPAEDFGLGVGDLLDRAEESEMDGSHGGDDGDVRPDQPRQHVDLAGVIHASLEYAKARVLRHVGE